MKSRCKLPIVIVLLACSLFASYSRNNSQSRLEKFTEVEIIGRVIKIVDGDTYHIVTGNYEQVKVRMAGIDAPEKGQSYFQKAKDFLGRLCFNKIVKIKIIDKDRNGRIIAESYLEDGTSLSHEMVKNGFAWHFKKYSSDEILARLEQQAQINKMGLWADKHPAAPWEFRAYRKKWKQRSHLNTN